MDAYAGGFLRDEDGAVVAVMEADATPPITYQNGYLRDADGALVIKAKDA